MVETACKSLAAYLDERRAHGLVDIKFYVRSPTDVTVSEACREAQTLFAAVETAKPFTFDDRRQRQPRAA